MQSKLFISIDEQITHLIKHFSWGNQILGGGWKRIFVGICHTFSQKYNKEKYTQNYLLMHAVNTLSINPTKWSNILEQYVGNS